ILIIYSNINGLLGWEDFAMQGFIKFQDYGLLITFALLFLGLFALNKTDEGYESIVRKMPLYNMINIYWAYYIALFVFSIFAMGSVIWPVKMGRVFFYGIIFYLVYRELRSDPIVRFEKILNCLMYVTILFGLCYIAYNTLGLDIYPKGAYESFEIGGAADDVKRNFSGFPMFAYYFIFVFTNRLIEGIGNKFINAAGLATLVLCVLLMLTRGTLILTVLMVIFLVMYRRPTLKTIKRFGVLIVLLAIVIVLIPYVAEGHYLAMVRRFEEFSGTGLTGARNFDVRTREFSQILKNVLDFDPLFGFGFTLASAFGYTSFQYHGGSADNGYSNLLGVTGFVGLGIFLMVIATWFIVNIRLQALKVEEFSKVNFVFIIFMLGAFMNGASMSYMHTYVLFMTYDLLAYSFYMHKSKINSTLSFSANSSNFGRKLRAD
ncbi:O-antigen ligase, partial [Rhodoferax sp. U11-2br]|uniref:O-antigen ligase family protein n=1 Tax=Rhodoferax sp. U11-2br TaxID=2838878 RepID=UPI001BEC2F99